MNSQIYEVGFQIVPTIAEEQLGEKVAELKAAIEAKKGTVVAEGFPAMKQLAYPIKKFNQAYFGWIVFELSVDEVAEVQKALESNSAVLRLLLIKSVRETEKVSAAPTKSKKPTAKKEEVDAQSIDKTIDELVVE